MKLNEEYMESEKIFDGTILHVYKDTVYLPNGEKATRELIRHTGAVCIVAIDENDSVVIERQFRYPFNRILTEIPAGKAETGEDPLECAKRELSEETGISAEDWEYMGAYYPSVAISDEVIHMYMARKLTYTGQHLDEDEFLELDKLPIEELVRMILNGEISDGKTQCAVLKVWNKYYK